MKRLKKRLNRNVYAVFSQDVLRCPEKIYRYWNALLKFGLQALFVQNFFFFLFIGYLGNVDGEKKLLLIIVGQCLCCAGIYGNTRENT